MWRKGRQIDPHFAPDEQLFRRLSRQQVEGDKVLPASVKLEQPSFSVNRGDGSEPEDVLVPSCGAAPETSYAGLGVAAFPVSAVTQTKKIHPEVPDYSLDVVHKPCDDNYFHSEVRTLYKNQFRENRRPGVLAKKYLRLKIFEYATVVVSPTR